MRRKSLKDKLFSELFEGVVRALEEVGFRFACPANDELLDDSRLKGPVLDQVFFIVDT